MRLNVSLTFYTLSALFTKLRLETYLQGHVVDV